jgi:hypothetical protein
MKTKHVSIYLDINLVPKGLKDRVSENCNTVVFISQTQDDTTELYHHPEFYELPNDVLEFDKMVTHYRKYQIPIVVYGGSIL